MISKEKIFRVGKYIFSAGSSLGIDLVLFSIFNYVVKSILIATVMARVISSLYNYFVNSRFVFKNYDKTSIFKYYLLVIVQMLVSACLVEKIFSMVSGINATIIKFFVDVVIFVVNYFVQKEVIFK